MDDTRSETRFLSCLRGHDPEVVVVERESGLLGRPDTTWCSLLPLFPQNFHIITCLLTESGSLPYTPQRRWGGNNYSLLSLELLTDK